jgi:hypothetical protein
MDNKATIRCQFIVIMAQGLNVLCLYRIEYEGFTNEAARQGGENVSEIFFDDGTLKVNT